LPFTYSGVYGTNQRKNKQFPVTINALIPSNTGQFQQLSETTLCFTLIEIQGNVV